MNCCKIIYLWSNVTISKNLLSIARENRVVYTVLNPLLELDSVTKYLQMKSVTILQARAMFNMVIEFLPSVRNRIDQDENMLYGKTFEKH